jgi:cohesin complex subunit SA-1/2
MAGAKALASLLVKWSRSLDKNHPEYGDGSDYTGVSKEVISLLAGQGDERIRSIVEALWDEVEAVSDWSSLLDFLLLDHSADENDRSRRSISRESEEESSVDEAWRLEESEEGVLLELLIASIRHAQAVEQANKKVEVQQGFLVLLLIAG